MGYPFDAITIYPDGSANVDEQNGRIHPLGWAISVTAKMEDASVFLGSFSHEVKGSISGLATFPQDSLSAEIIACIWAVVWSILWMQQQARFNHPTHGWPVTITIRPDNSTVVAICTKARVPIGYEDLATLLISLVDHSDLYHHITFTHIDAHKDDPWNELSDTLAKWSGKHVGMPFHPTAHDFIDALVGGVEADWAWLHSQSSAAYPCILDSTIQGTPTRDAVSWPYPISVNSDLSPLSLIRYISYKPQSMLDVTTRGMSQRPRHIREQLASCNPAFVGMQETRDDEFQRRMGQFLVTSSPSNKRVLGCQFLVNTETALLPSGRPILFKHMAVACSEPRFVAANIDNGAHTGSYIVAHAPQNSASSAERR